MDTIGDTSAIELEAELAHNPALLGMEADCQAGRFSYGTFADFVSKQTEYIPTPRRPNTPICYEENALKKRVFAEVANNLRTEHRHEITDYEAKKARQDRLKQNPASYAGFAKYLAENHKKDYLPFLLGRHTIPISEAYRLKHTYITGGSGSGKSEVIKSFIWHYLTRNTSTAIILLTPHDEIALQVAKFKVNLRNDRLVYINPRIDNFEHFPCLNPFDIDGKEHMSDITAETYAAEFVLVFNELLEGNLTEQMELLLKNTLTVLMKLEGSSIYDLINFLEPIPKKQEGNTEHKSRKYLDFAKKCITHNLDILDFFEGQFLSDEFNRTKSSLTTRLRYIFSSSIMQGVMRGKRTVDLNELMNQKKLIVLDISKDMAQEWAIIGKFLIAQIKIIAFSRKKAQEKTGFIVPCHLFIDECQNYITTSLEEMLNEARKFGIYLTLAQQTAGAKMNEDLYKSVLGNTGVKITGKNAEYTLSKMATETGAEYESLEGLGTGRFSLYKASLAEEKQNHPIVVTMPTNTLDDKQSMDANEWEAVKRAQIAMYYRTPTNHTHRSANSTPEGEKTGQTPPSGNSSQQNTKKPKSKGRGATIDDLDLDDYVN